MDGEGVGVGSHGGKLGGEIQRREGDEGDVELLKLLGKMGDFMGPARTAISRCWNVRRE